MDLLNQYLKNKTMNTVITNIIGYILLSPALISVVMFIAQFTTEEKIFKNFMYTIWTGNYGYNNETGGGGGFTSALPFYFGLMAIAGAYLIKDKK